MADTAGFWDGEASSFDDEADHGLRDPAVRDAWGALLRSVLPAPPAAVVDLGCGTGSLSVLLAAAGYTVTGIDFSRAMLVAALRKAADAGIVVTFRRGDASAPELEAASVDAVVVRHVTWALPDPADAIRRWAALLRPPGRLVLVEGQWSTGAGLSARALTDLVHPVIADIEVQPLTDPALWGGPITDERYVLVGRT
jgi:ubiquinone/menaquinone biosynthesis C-methylase UbiE